MTSLIQPAPNYQNVACVAPFSSMFVNSNGDSFPCCKFNYRARTRIDESKDQNWNFNNINQKIREEFLSKGSDISSYDNCFMCSLNPKGGQYLRHNLSANEDIDYITNPTLTNLHLKFSNQCNLACRICESGCSSLLNSEDKLLMQANIRKEGLPRLNLRLDPNSVLMASIKENIHNLNTLYISGGEPLLQEEVWEFLQLAFDQGYSKNIALEFNTNGTVKLSKERYDILKSFKKIDIMVSMDGIGKHAEYIRTNSSWERWVENVKNYQQEFINYPNLRLTIILTVSVYNVHIVDKILSFFTDELNIHVDLNFVYEPYELCVFNINQSLKDELVNYYRQQLAEIKNENNKTRVYNELINFINNKNNISHNEIIPFIDGKDNIVIANNLYKNYKAYKDVDIEWYNKLK